MDAVRLRMTLIGRTMLIVFPVLWLAWFAPWDDLLDRRGTPLGADFSMFYTAGRLALEGDLPRLYDQALHQQRLHELFPHLAPEFCLPYRYPPLVAMCMAPLAAMPYAVAFLVFTLLSVSAVGAAMLIGSRQFALLRSNWRSAVLWSVAGWPVLWETLMGGQASPWSLLILCGGVAALANDRQAVAGVILALAAYKPNVLVFVILGCAIRYPRMLRGLLPALAALAVASYCVAGWDGLRDYAQESCRLAAGPWDVETPVWKLHSLASWFGMIPGVPARAVTAAIGLLVATSIGVAWRHAGDQGSATFYRAVAALVLVNATFNPYTPIYDLLILLVCLLAASENFSAEWFGAGTLQTGLALFYFGPHFSQSLAQATGVQLDSLALAAAAVWLSVGFVRSCFDRVAVTPAEARLASR